MGHLRGQRSRVNPLIFNSRGAPLHIVAAIFGGRARFSEIFADEMLKCIDPRKIVIDEESME